MAARRSMRPSWTGGAALGALLAAALIGGAFCHRAERAADIEVEVNGALTTSKYLTTTRPLPTGVLLSSAPTFVSDGTTSEYTTLVVGTVANGYYSRIVSTAERVFYAIARTGERPQPTGVVSEAVNTEVHGDATTVHRTRFIRTSLGSHYGQVIERTSSVLPQLESSTQEPGLPTLTIGMPISYPSKAPLVTELPEEVNEVPTARRVVQGEEVIIVDEEVRPSPPQRRLPTYTADEEGSLRLDEPVVVVPNRASFQKTQALLNEKVNKMVKDLNLKEGSNRESRDFSDLETIEILDLDLALSGSELTTVTYVGFSDFITTIGSTVVVFMPQSAGAEQIRSKISRTAQFVGPTRAGKSVVLSRAPVFVPDQGNVITTTRTFASNDATSTVTPDSEATNEIAEEAAPVKDDGVLSTASTRVYNTVDLYPTGLVTSIGGTVAREKVTTVFTTLVYGTFIKGRYAKVVKSTSSIYFLVSKTANVEPTAVVQSASTIAVDRGNLGRAVGSRAGAQVIVGSAEEAKAALKQSQQLEGSLAPSSAPPLFSSQADGEEEKSVLKTYYTTFTYYTTLSSGDQTEVKTSLSTVTSVATEELPRPALTYFTTFTYFTTSSVDGKEIVSTRYETKSQIAEPTKAPTSTAVAPAKLVTKTFFTTYTYFTTSHSGESSVVQSRLVVSSNVVTSTVPISATATSNSPVKSVDPTSATPAIQYSTGLLSSLVSSEVNDGVTTISSTGYFGTSVHGLYAQIIKSTTMTIDPALTPSSVAPVAATPVSETAAISTLSSQNPSVSATPTLDNPASETDPSSAISTSPKKLLSSISAQISSSAASSSSRIQSTNRSFLPFRTSTKRKSSGLLALLAAKRAGLGAPEPTSEPTKPEPTSTANINSPSPVEDAEATEAPPSPVLEEEPAPTSTERRFPLRTRRPFPGLRRPGGRPGLRGLFNRNQPEEEEEVTEPTQDETTTVASEVEEEPVDPTEEVVIEEVIETTTEAVTTRPPRVLAFGRNRSVGGTRNALPLRRRPKPGGRGGLISRFSSVIAGGEETTTTTTTTTTTEAPTEPPTEPPTERPTKPEEQEELTEITPRRVRGRGRGRLAVRGQPQTIRRTVRRRRPIRGRRRRPVEENDLQGAGSEVYEQYVAAEPLPEHNNFFEQNHFLDDAGSEVAVVVSDVDPLQAAAEGAILSRTKRQSSFGARSRSRASRGDSLSKQETLIEAADHSVSSTGTRARRQNRGRTRARNSRQSEANRGRNVDPTPSEDTKEKFTLTSGRSRGSSRSRSRTGSSRTSSSSTRRAIPGSRRNRPSSSSGSGSGLAVSLRQRLQQAQVAAAGISEPPRATTPEPAPSRGTSSRGSSSRRPSPRGPSGSRIRQRQPLFGQDRTRDPPDPEPEIIPTPVLDEGQIIVVSAEQVAVSIPVIADGRTSFRDVFTANTVTNTLEPGQYTETEVNGEMRTHVGTKTAVGSGGQTELSTLYLSPTEIKTSLRIPTKIRGRISNVRSTYTQPGFTVVPEVNTVSAAQIQPSPALANNNNPLTALLQQLLASQGQPAPVLSGSFNAPVAAPPQQAFRTVSYTTSYVTTVTESDFTTVPIFFQGRKTHTVIINSDVQVITATEVITSTERIPGQTAAPAAAFGGLGVGLGALGGLTPQQLLLQQLLNQPPRLQLPAIQPTAARSLLPQSQPPPQLEELLRQATEVDQQQPAAQQQPASTSVVTIFVSGSKPGEFFTRLSTVTLDGPEVTRIKRGQLPTAAVRPTEIPAFIETDQGLFKVPKNAQVFGDLDFYVMSAMNEIEPDMIKLGATQTLESVKGSKATRYREKIIDVAPSLTDRPSSKTNSFLWEGPAESAPLRREKRQATRGRDGSNGNDPEFAPLNNAQVRRIKAPEFTTYTYDNTVTDEFGSIIVKSTQHVLPKLRTYSNIEFVELTKLGAKPTLSENLLFGILQTEVDSITKTLTARASARKSLRGGQYRSSGLQTARRTSASSRQGNRGRTNSVAGSNAAVRNEGSVNVSRKRNPLTEKDEKADATTLRSSFQEEITTAIEGPFLTTPLPPKEQLLPKNDDSDEVNNKITLEKNGPEDFPGPSFSRGSRRRAPIESKTKQVSLPSDVTISTSSKPLTSGADAENVIQDDIQPTTRGRRVRVRTRERKPQTSGGALPSNQSRSRNSESGSEKTPSQNSRAESSNESENITSRRTATVLSRETIRNTVVPVQGSTKRGRGRFRANSFTTKQPVVRPTPDTPREIELSTPANLKQGVLTDGGIKALDLSEISKEENRPRTVSPESTVQTTSSNNIPSISSSTTASLPESDTTSPELSLIDDIDTVEDNEIIPTEATTPLPVETKPTRGRRVRVRTRLVGGSKTRKQTGSLKPDSVAVDPIEETTEPKQSEKEPEQEDDADKKQSSEGRVSGVSSAPSTSRRPSSRRRVVSRARQRVRTKIIKTSKDSPSSATTEATTEVTAADTILDVPQSTSSADQRRIRVRLRRPTTESSSPASSISLDSATSLNEGHSSTTVSDINEIEEIEHTTSSISASRTTSTVSQRTVQRGTNRSQSESRTQSSLANPATSRRNLRRRPTPASAAATTKRPGVRTGIKRTSVIRRRPVQPKEKDEVELSNVTENASSVPLTPQRAASSRRGGTRRVTRVRTVVTPTKQVTTERITDSAGDSNLESLEEFEVDSPAEPSPAKEINSLTARKVPDSRDSEDRATNTANRLGAGSSSTGDTTDATTNLVRKVKKIKKIVVGQGTESQEEINEKPENANRASLFSAPSSPRKIKSEEDQGSNEAADRNVKQSFSRRRKVKRVKSVFVPDEETKAADQLHSVKPTLRRQRVRVTRTRTVARVATSITSAAVPKNDRDSSGATDIRAQTPRRQRIQVTRPRGGLRPSVTPTNAPEVVSSPTEATTQLGSGRFRERPTVSTTRSRSRGRVTSRPISQEDGADSDIATEISTNSLFDKDTLSENDTLDNEVSTPSKDEAASVSTSDAPKVQRKRVRKLKRKKIIEPAQSSDFTTESPLEENPTDSAVRRGSRRRVVKVRRRFPTSVAASTSPDDATAEDETTRTPASADELTDTTLEATTTDTTSSESVSEAEASTEITDTVRTTERQSRDPNLFSRFNRRRRPSTGASQNTVGARLDLPSGRDSRRNRLRRPASSVTATEEPDVILSTEEQVEAATEVVDIQEESTTTIATTTTSTTTTEGSEGLADLRSRVRLPFRSSRRRQRPTASEETTADNDNSAEAADEVDDEVDITTTTTERSRSLSGFRSRNRLPIRPNRPSRPSRPQRPRLPALTEESEEGSVTTDSQVVIDEPADVTTERTRGRFRLGNRRPSRPTRPSLPLRPTPSPRRRPLLRLSDEDSGEEIDSNSNVDSTTGEPDSRPDRVRLPFRQSTERRRPTRPALFGRPRRPSVFQRLAGAVPSEDSAARIPERTVPRTLDQRRNENELFAQRRPSLPSQQEAEEEEEHQFRPATTSRPPLRQNIAPETRRPLATAAPSLPDDESIDEVETEDFYEEDIQDDQIENGVSDPESGSEEDIVSEDLPSNVVYRKFSTVRLVEILGGRQTLTLPVVTSTLTTLAPSDLHLLTDSPGLFDGTLSVATPAAVPAVRATRTEQDRTGATRALFGSLPAAPSREFKPSATVTAASDGPVSSVRGLAGRFSVDEEQPTSVSAVSRPRPTAAEGTRPSSPRRPPFRVASPSGADSVEDGATVSSTTPVTAESSSPVRPAVATTQSTTPDIQSSLSESDVPDAGAISDGRTILASSSSSARATPSLTVPGRSRFSGVPLFPRPRQTTYRAVTSSGTVLIFGELVTGPAINQRQSESSSRRSPFGRTVAAEDVSQVLATSALVTGIATKVMNNGVPVLVAGGGVPPEQVVSNGQVVFNSGTLTLPPVSLSDVVSLMPSSETDPELGTRGTSGFDQRFYRTQTYYTTFTYLVRRGGQAGVTTSRETVSNVVTVPATAAARPQSTRFETATYFTTFTYFTTTTRGAQEQVTSSQEVVTRVVVTEAPATAPQQVTKTYLSTVTLFDTAFISGTQVLRSRSTSVITQLDVGPPAEEAAVRPSTVRPPIQATAAPSPLAPVRPPPAVDPSLPPVGEQDEIHVVATKTYYTTSTFYTTLLEGSATVVRTRTEVTSRVQTEKVTTRLAASHLSSLRGSLTRTVSPAVALTRTPTLGQAAALSTENRPSQAQATETKPTSTLLSGDLETAGPAAGQGQSGFQIPEPASVVESSVLTPVENVDQTQEQSSTDPVTANAELTSTTSSDDAGSANKPTTAATASPAAQETIVFVETASPAAGGSGSSPSSSSTAALTVSTTPAPGSPSTTSKPPAEALGNLAGSLLSLSGLGAAGLSGINIGSMVDTAAGLFRNVLPLAVRRDGSAGVPPEPVRPPPAVQVQQRNPAFIPVGGLANSLRREQQLATAEPAGLGGPSGPVLAVRGPDGQVIPIRGVPSTGRRPPQRSGVPARRQDRPRRPGPLRRPPGPNGRPLRPANRRKQPPPPNGFIAVFPNGQEPSRGQPEENFLQLERIEDRPGQPFQFQLPHQLGPAAGSTRVHVSITTGAETQFVRPTAVDGRPPFSAPQPQPVVVVGATLASEFDANRRVDQSSPDSGSQPTYVEAELGGNTGGFSNELTGQGFTGQQEFLGGGFADQQGLDDQEYAASVQGPFGTGQLTFFDSSDGGFQPDSERRRPLVRPPVPVPNQVLWPPRSTSTLHTTASLEGDNRIVGTNVFADVVPITTRPAVIQFQPNPNRPRRPPPVRPAPSAPALTPQVTRGPEFTRPPAPASAPAPAPAPVPVRNRIPNQATLEVPVPISGQVPVPVSIVIPARNPVQSGGIFNRPNTESVIRVTTEEAITETSPSEAPEIGAPQEPRPDVGGDDLELSASTERGQTAKKPQQTSGSISGDEENNKINFIVTSSFESSTATPTTTGTPSLASTRQPIRLADRIRQTLLASLSSAAAASASASSASSFSPSFPSSTDLGSDAGSSVRIGSTTAILGPDVRTLRPDTRTTSRHHSSETVIRGESTVFGGLFTRPALPSESVHDITEIVNGPGHQPVTKYITRTEQFTRTVTATKTDIRFEGSAVVTSTKVITSTLPPITIVSTVIGTSTQIHTLNTATPTRVEPLRTANTSTRQPPTPSTPPPPPPPPRRPEPTTNRERERERDRVSVAGVLLADSIDLDGAQQGITDDNEVNRVVISPGAGQHLVVEQAEAVATRCQRPCLEAIFETCRPIGGVYQCACRPGFARAREQDPCEPTLTYRLQVLLDRVNDIPLSFRPQFADRSSAEYEQLARITERGLQEALIDTELGDRLHTTKLMGFVETEAAGAPGLPRTRPPPSLDGLLAELMVQVSERESDSLDRSSLRHTLAEALRSTNYSMGGQQLVVSQHSDAITALDFDECQDGDYNDCHEQAFCYNLAGTFTCSCRDGMVDLNVNDAPGRACSTESAGCKECSYSGECYAQDGGGTGCRCHRWYAGTRCQINLRVLLIALVTVGAVLALMLCACCFLCCRRRRGRSHVAPPLVFTGPAGFLRHRGTDLGNPVLDRRAMLDSSSDTSATSPPRMLGAPPPVNKRPAPVPPASVAGRSRRSGRTNASFQEERSLASTAIRPAVFIPRAKHRHPQPRPASAASSAVRVGPDGGADLRASQSRLMSVLEPAGRGRMRPRAGTFTAPQRSARSVSGGRRPRREEAVSHHPTGRSRSSDSLSLRAESIGGDADYRAHSFFRERTMSEARSYDETTIRPSVRSVRGYGTQRSRRSSLAGSSQMLTYEHHTMAERDAASTFVMPETQLFRPQADSDALSEFSVVDDFPQIHGRRSSRAASAAGSRRGPR
ncbi:mucin-17-like [Amphibalanus amphitrite]|uniref:mucin-17-like n=1 Tax=Amphibalanus amphitrite TaxID=1232801 RepID=UPI001C928BEC|nr:mucin-17-like [Amphibalanus amphitrite]